MSVCFGLRLCFPLRSKTLTSRYVHRLRGLVRPWLWSLNPAQGGSPSCSLNWRAKQQKRPALHLVSQQLSESPRASYGDPTKKCCDHAQLFIFIKLRPTCRLSCPKRCYSPRVLHQTQRMDKMQPNPLSHVPTAFVQDVVIKLGALQVPFSQL